ncbi:TPA: EpsG family protein, partial [Escherichia coli]|nr:EpsG family protein [Escherichia coli]
MGVYFILITVALLISIIVLFHNDVKFTNVYIYTYILLLSLLAGLR